MIQSVKPGRVMESPPFFLDGGGAERCLESWASLIRFSPIRRFNNPDVRRV